MKLLKTMTKTLAITGVFYLIVRSMIAAQIIGFSLP